jgi:hypothetical protein
MLTTLLFVLGPLWAASAASPALGETLATVTLEIHVDDGQDNEVWNTLKQDWQEWGRADVIDAPVLIHVYTNHLATWESAFWTEWLTWPRCTRSSPPALFLHSASAVAQPTDFEAGTLVTLRNGAHLPTPHTLWQWARNTELLARHSVPFALSIPHEWHTQLPPLLPAWDGACDPDQGLTPTLPCGQAQPALAWCETKDYVVVAQDRVFWKVRQQAELPLDKPLDIRRLPTSTFGMFETVSLVPLEHVVGSMWRVGNRGDRTAAPLKLRFQECSERMPLPAALQAAEWLVLLVLAWLILCFYSACRMVSDWYQFHHKGTKKMDETGA